MSSVHKFFMLWAVFCFKMDDGNFQTTVNSSNRDESFNENFNYPADTPIHTNLTDMFLNDNVYFEIKLLSRTGFFLRIGPDGHVSGTTDCKDKYVRLTTFTFGPNLFVIHGLFSDLYLSMDRKGRISARNNTESTMLIENNFDILWREHHNDERSCFVSFQSYEQFRVSIKDSDMLNNPNRTQIVNRSRFLAIRKHGRTTSSDNPNINIEFLKLVR